MKKNKDELIQQWGKPKNRNFNFELIKQYSNYKISQSSNQLNEKSLIDLDFNSFYKFIDRTSSAVGQQFLFDQLINQSINPEYLKKREDQVDFYNSNFEKKAKTQIVLSKLSKTNDYYFPFLIFSELPQKLYSSWIIILLQTIMIIGILLTFKFPVAFLFVIILFVINLGLHYLHKSRIGNFTIYFSRLTSLSTTLRKIIPLSNYNEANKSKLLSDVKHIDQITSQVLFLKTDNLQNSEFGAIFWFIFELFKILTLSEISVFNKLVNKVRSSRLQIEYIFKAIGEIDVAISICSLRDGLPYYSIPNFTKSSKELIVKGIYHPLVSDCVSNDIELKNKSLLLTGSNMAGKSTFIKALNLNALSSQVLNTSFSYHYSAPIWHLMTSMTIKDNLNDNSSYYMEEVNSIGQLIISSKRKDTLYLFTIDEIFKGTNTIERISTAKAILEFLNINNHMVLVSTHDIELTKLLSGGFDLHFFQESIANQSLSFDYILKKGTLEKSNAINILEIVGYPKSITDEAKKLALKIKNEKTGFNSF